MSRKKNYPKNECVESILHHFVLNRLSFIVRDLYLDKGTSLCDLIENESKWKLIKWKMLANKYVNSPLLCDENAEFFGFGGSFGVVSPGEKLGGVFELQRMKRKLIEMIEIQAYDD